jgi:hypothetical protein
MSINFLLNFYDLLLRYRYVALTEVFWGLEGTVKEGELLGGIASRFHL